MVPHRRDGSVTHRDLHGAVAVHGRLLRYASARGSHAEPATPARAGRRARRGLRIVVVMPAYNAAKTLERTYADIPHDLVDEIILVDDCRRDDTVEVARQLGPRRHHPPPEPRLRRQPEDLLRRGARGGADIVVMLHPDYQYDATRIPALVAPIAAGHLRRRARQPLPRRGARPAGMPLWKYVANRFLTGVENPRSG